jgi:adenylate kinase family enzyme
MSRQLLMYRMNPRRIAHLIELPVDMQRSDDVEAFVKKMEQVYMQVQDRLKEKRVEYKKQIDG